MQHLLLFDLNTSYVKVQRKQETRSGKNLCDNNYKNYKIDNYGYKKIIDSEENLIASLVDKDTSVDLTGIYFGFTHTGKDTIEGMVWVINNGVETANKTNQGIHQYISFYPANEETFNKIFARYDIQVEKGTTATDYEPYGASPSPEFPSEIQNVEGNANVTVCNKNLCYKSIIQNNNNINFYFNTKSIAKEVAISFIADKSLKGNSIYCKADGVSIGRILAQVTANANSKANAQIIFTDEEYEKVKNADEVYFQLYKAGANFETINEPMIENSPTATDYVPHQEQNFTFPLAEGQKLYKGDYLADDGIHHKRKQVELDGTENWSENINYTTETLLVAQVLITNAKNQTANVLSNYFLYKSTSTEKNTLRFASTLLLITIDKNQFADVPALKTWLAKQKQTGTPVILEYELAEEEIEAYTPEQQEAYNKIVQTAKSYKNVTNIYSPDPVSPVFEVNYRKDIESMINNSLNNVNQQILNIV